MAGPQLSVETLTVDGDRQHAPGRAHQPGIGDQGGVVTDDPDMAASQVDVGVAATLIDRPRERVAGSVDVAAPIRQPEADVDTRVAEGVGQCHRQLRPVGIGSEPHAELDQLTRPGEPAAQQTDGECERQDRQHSELDRRQCDRVHPGERLDHVRRHGHHDCGEDAVPEDRAEHAACRWCRRPQPAEGDDGRGHEDHRADAALRPLGKAFERGVVGDQCRRIRVEQPKRDLQDGRREIRRGDDPPRRDVRQPAGWERQHEVHDHSDAECR